ncbi:chemotaxis protein CheW [Acuticoccus sp. M5D2P5]|uniref:chemotaxis protein CheW n=1 Tax=Acuticoccus kalidii TaxID=2910977 RepID=UPI001F2886E4|nr:chemotaxis protein CheW [Acuticoccus kalidii]MCF3932955.1 chemotaxis protein CheW [Acuticoccus kalidii]
MNVVTMRLGGEIMAIPTDCLREILEPVPVTRVPRAGAFSNSLINVRGAVVPLADLRVAFAMGIEPATMDTRMVVLDVPIGGESITVAIIADKVHDVSHFDPAGIEDLPAVGHAWPPDFIRGIGKWQNDFVILPDLETVFSQAVQNHAPAASLSDKET